MKAKLAIAAFLILGVAALSHAYVRGYPPFTPQFVQTCENAIKQRLADSSTYQRVDVVESRRTLTFDEFFADPMRAVSESSRKAMIQIARVPPVQLVALIDYEAQSFVGAIIRERATCTFNSLEGTDAPTRTYWVMIDGEYNTAWAARQPNAAAVQLRVFKEQ